MSANEQAYLQLLRDVLEHGERKSNRTGVDTIGLFGATCKYDLSHSQFPLLTTKKVFWKGVVVELLWLLSGSSSVKPMQEQGVTIWDEWAKPDGELGPVYGVQWRRWHGYAGHEHDQIATLVHKLKHQRNDRRMIVSAWNVEDLDKMGLPPCHWAFQCYVSPDGHLDLMMHQRSADLFLGVPFNIASYSLLLMMLAQVADLKPRYFIHTLGDYHIYENHLDQVREQLSREPRPLPQVFLRPDIKKIDDFRLEHIMLKSYDPWPAIKGEVAV